MRYGLLLMSVVTVWAGLVGGCAKQQQPGVKTRKQTLADFASAFAGGADRQLSGNTPKVQYLDVYQLTLPVGAVSRS